MKNTPGRRRGSLARPLVAERAEVDRAQEEHQRVEARRERCDVHQEEGVVRCGERHARVDVEEVRYDAGQGERAAQRPAPVEREADEERRDPEDDVDGVRPAEGGARERGVVAVQSLPEELGVVSAHRRDGGRAGAAALEYARQAGNQREHGDEHAEPEDGAGDADGRRSGPRLVVAGRCVGAVMGGSSRSFVGCRGLGRQCARTRRLHDRPGGQADEDHGIDDQTHYGGVLPQDADGQRSTGGRERAHEPPAAAQHDAGGGDHEEHARGEPDRAERRVGGRVRVEAGQVRGRVGDAGPDAPDVLQPDEMSEGVEHEEARDQSAAARATRPGFSRRSWCRCRCGRS